MAFSLVTCSYCSKDFLKDNRHINENVKLGNNFYCSPKCQYSFKNKQIELKCENPTCVNKFKRASNAISSHNYCSRSCAVVVNNVKFPKRLAKVRLCGYCGEKMFTYGRMYCSVRCRGKAQAMTGEEIVGQIRTFYNEQGRIPLKREFNHYHVARDRFGNWNNAVKVAGFKPNPVLFAERQVSEDGHICDSIAEMSIDDYLYEKGIPHDRCVPYPGGIYTADFKVEDVLIEYFGLAGEHKRYDELKEIKQSIAKLYNLKLVEIYPKDLYPRNRLGEILKI